MWSLITIIVAPILAPIVAAIAVANDPQSLPAYSIYPRQAANLSSASTAQPNFTFTELLNLNKKFLDSFVYPANTAVAKSINSTLLSEDVQGRVDITRTFDGRELNTEYLFGLFANLAAATDGGVSLLGVPLSYEVLHFAASQNIASALTRFQFNFTALNLVLPLQIETWNTYNAQGQITQYDATFKYWQWTVDYLIQAAAKQFRTPTPDATVKLLSGAIAKSICGTSQKYCNGTNVQYQSAEQCLGFLTQKVRFGQAYELGKNTLLCRMVHQNMVPFRPDVHCPHIGPTGGGYCDDEESYLETVNGNYFTNAPFVPFGVSAKG
ncbi:MAG: hypothetical protein Q9220_000109 [cf. Caloplaca sp. 1 TL-2023]